MTPAMPGGSRTHRRLEVSRNSSLPTASHGRPLTNGSVGSGPIVYYNENDKGLTSNMTQWICVSLIDFRECEMSDADIDFHCTVGVLCNNMSIPVLADPTIVSIMKS